MNSPISVSSLNEQLKSLLETTFCTVYVEGEVSNLTYHNSGHIYFSIKDKNSTISCVMFRGNAQYLKFRLENGQKIVISGNITVYTPRGSYQLLCTKIEPSGVGALALAYEQLKTKLQIKGYFDKNIKKPLPQFPKIIYIITSNTGAAIQDMQKILSHRYPIAKMILIPTLVQGEGSKENIVKNINIANKLALKSKDSSFIIVGRGGGSIEDLWAFNEECVADAIFQCDTPIVSAVGHENDFVISDFVSDIRASTPSNAIEISTPDINNLKQYLDNLENDFNKLFKNIFTNKQLSLETIKTTFKHNSILSRFNLVQNSIINLKSSLNSNFKVKLQNIQTNLNTLEDTYLVNEPSKKDKNGFVQVTQNGSLCNLKNLKKNDNITLETSKLLFDAKITNIHILN